MKFALLLIVAIIAKISAAQEWEEDFFRVVDDINPITPAHFTMATQSPGYDYDYYLDSVAIDAPLDNCLGQNAYLGLVTFKGAVSDADGVDRCSAACDSKLDEAQPCVFFNSYTLNKNGVPIAQHCALYSQAWSSSWATNAGQYRGNDHYTISESVTFYNIDDHGPCQATS